MADAAAPTPGRELRAEFILAMAIAAVSLFVLAIAAMLWVGARLRANEADVVAEVRDARAVMIAVSRAQTDAEMLAARYLATRDRSYLTAFAGAKSEVRRGLQRLHRVLPGDAEAAARVARIDAVAERRLAVLDEEVTQPSRARAAARAIDALDTFRAEATAIADLFNDRIDVARAAENASRRQQDALSLTLAALALIGSGLAYYAIRRDREQWRLAHEAAEAARTAAIASDLAKTRFLAAASHDMRQPLHALTLYLAALERRVEGAEARGIVEKMNRATRSMVGMFSTLLDLARIQAGAVQPEITAFPLQEAFDRILAEHPQAGIEAPRTAIVVKSDPLLLERLLSNLVSNGLRHGGGEVRIEVEAGSTHATVAVIDRGPGIPEVDRERIFEEFVRLDGRRGEGLGLGLAIVRRIAALLGTPVEVHSPPGGGARFSVRVPLAGAASAPRPARGPTDLAGACIAVMEDDVLAREAIAEVLRDAGAEVRDCGDEAGLRAVLQTPPAVELVVADLRIGGRLQGLDVAKRARLEVDRQLPIVVVTGDTGPDTLSLLRASGCAWLIKPVEPSQLTETIAAALRQER